MWSLWVHRPKVVPKEMVMVGAGYFPIGKGETTNVCICFGLLKLHRQDGLH